MNATTVRKTAPKAATVPFHVFLSRALDEAQLSNPDVAQRLGYSKANVISMMRHGSMKVPINKIPDLADMLKMSRMDLLMMALNEYDPAFLECLKRTLGEGQTLAKNELAILEVVRSVMPSGDFNLTESDDFVMALTALVGREAERHKQESLRPDPEAKPREGGKNALLNKEYAALLARQARERQKLFERMTTEVGAGVVGHRKVA